MKVLLINGSRRENGCTFTALNLVGDELKNAGIETEMFNAGAMVFKGAIDEAVKNAVEKIKVCDGIVVGSPVYYASPSGEIVSFLDRLFGMAEGELRFKVAASISSCRRAGNTACLDVLNKYFLYNCMPIVSSRYWNEIHGKTPEEVLKDEEGVQIMKVLGKNMAWLLKSIEAGKNNGVTQPESVEKVFTNYI